MRNQGWAEDPGPGLVSLDRPRPAMEWSGFDLAAVPFRRNTPRFHQHPPGPPIVSGAGRVWASVHSAAVAILSIS